MKTLLSTSALALCVALPSAGSAQDVNLSYGATLTSRYVSSGVAQSSGAALQPWVEVDAAGFYAGLWASNTSLAITGGKYELDVYAGYRNEIGQFSYDVGYARYYYYKPYTNCCGEWYVGMGVAATDSLGLGVKFNYDPVAKVTNSKLTVDYAINDKVGLSAEIGKNKGGRTYGSIGASYGINDNFSISGAYHDSDVSDALFVVSLDTSFSLR